MRRFGGIAAILALTAACTSSGGSDPTSAPLTTSPPPVTSSVSTPTSTPVSTPTTPPPTTPTVPADVPTTGPNARKGEKPPVMPALATQHTPAGAAAFAKFYVATIDWAYATMSTTYARHFTASACSDCLSSFRSIDEARRSGYRFIGGRITVLTTKLDSRPATPDAERTGIVKFAATAFEALDGNGKLLNAQPARSGYRFEVSIRWAASGWQVVDLGLDR